MSRKYALILACTTLYAIIRYIVFGHVSTNNLPIYVLNKSLSMTAVFCLMMAGICYAKKEINKVKFWGSTSLQSAYVHILLSLAILSKDYYPKFFAIEKMNLTGEITILFGVLAAYCYWLLRQIRSDGAHRFLQIFSCVFITLHLVAMGFSGWLKVSGWYGGLPPISLLSFVLTIISLVLFSKKQKEFSK